MSFLKKKFEKGVIRNMPSARMRFKKLLRCVVSFIAYYSGLSPIWYFLFARHAVRILTYHGIELTPTNSYAVSVANFEKHMQHLSKYFNVISLDQYQKGIKQKISFPPNTVIITVDDGFKNFYEQAYPILKKYCLPSTCFVITSKVLSDNDDFMHWKELSEILADGLVTVGSHSVSHRSLSVLNEFELQREVGESKKILENNLGMPINFFSYPCGTLRDFNENSTKAILKFHYKLACTSVNGINRNNKNPYKLRRTKLEWGDNLSIFTRILRGSLDIWIVVDYCFRFLQKKEEVDFKTKKTLWENKHINR